MTGTNSTLGGAAINSGATQTVTLNVLGHANPVLSIAGGNSQTVIVGATDHTAGLSLSNGTAAQTGLASLDVNSLGSGVSGSTGGKLVASGSAQSHTAAMNTSVLVLSPRPFRSSRATTRRCQGHHHKLLFPPAPR